MSQWCSLTSPLKFDSGFGAGVDSTGSSRSQTEPALDPFTLADQVVPRAVIPADAPVITPTITYTVSRPEEDEEEDEDDTERRGDRGATQDREWWERLPPIGPSWFPRRVDPRPPPDQPAPRRDNQGVPAPAPDVVRDDGVLRGPTTTEPDTQDRRRERDAEVTSRPPIFIGDLFRDDDDEDDPMAFDLGDLLGGVRQTVDTYRYVTGDYPAGTAPRTTVEPPVVIDNGGSVVVKPPGKRQKNGAGCRRRRRRLLTKSDLGDIAALKGIVGTGKNFENILAAAMYRSR